MKTKRNPAGFPSIAALRSELAGQFDYMRKSFSREDLSDPTDRGNDSAGMDVRLQVQGGSWSLHTGDSQFDQDHRGSWGCGFLPWERSNLTDLARELISDALSNYDDSDESAED